MLNIESNQGFISSLNLYERLDLLDALPKPSEDIRLDNWLQHHPSLKDFEARLLRENISLEDFKRVLSLDAISEQSTNWITPLLNIYDDERFKIQAGDLGLATFILPILNKFTHDLDAELNKLQNIHLDKEAIIKNLTDTFNSSIIMPIIMRTIILEMNVARMQGILAGDTKEARYLNYIEQLKSPDVAINILQEYAPMARSIWEIGNEWVNNSVRVLQRLDADVQDITQTLKLDFTQKLVKVESGAGDKHRGGQSVIILHFEDGQKLVYKPKSLAVDRHFQELLGWINEQNILPEFKQLTMLDRHDYGWVEFIQAEPCNDHAQLKRFYERQGAYLALLYSTEAVDFHLENLIAAGEHPILIDLESLFHAHMDSPAGPSGARRKAIEAIEYSVLRIGLLPQRIMGNSESDGIDMSGMSGKGGQLSPFASPAIAAGGTDEMRLTRKHFEIQGANNLPTLNNTSIDVIEYLDDIVHGFETMYHLLMSKRDILMTEDGIFSRFADDEIRIIIRPTRYYGRLINESYHPDLLRDMMDREAFFEHAWRYAYQDSSLMPLIPYERKAMLAGDIPYFTAKPQSCDLWTGDGTRFPDFFKESPLQTCEKRLYQFDNADLERQKWFIRGSFAAMTVGKRLDTMVSYKPFVPQISADKDNLLAAAKAVGERLYALALRGDGDSTWLGISLLDERNWTLAPLGADFYSGLTGITFFLAYLGHISGDDKFTQLARESLNTCQGIFSTVEIDDVRVPIGYFSGIGGMMAFLTHLGVLWEDQSLLEQAQSLIPILMQKIPHDDKFDIIDGAAGCLISLLNLHRVTGYADAIEAAKLCGETLLANAEQQPIGIAWRTGETKDFLIGFSHGTAGIAKALFDLATITGEARYREAAHAAIAYERTKFSPEFNNWPDLRAGVTYGTDDNNFMVAWCHGAVGVGLARLDYLPHLADDLHVQEEIKIAVDTTIKQGFAINHSLCHGGLGNLELILKASAHDSSLTKTVDDALAMILESVQQHGWLTGVPRGIESPGLMTGIAGIGYAFLKFYAPDRVPSILLLEAPYG